MKTCSVAVLRIKRSIPLVVIDVEPRLDAFIHIGGKLTITHTADIGRKLRRRINGDRTFLLFGIRNQRRQPRSRPRQSTICLRSVKVDVDCGLFAVPQRQFQLIAIRIERLVAIGGFLRFLREALLLARSDIGIIKSSVDFLRHPDAYAVIEFINAFALPIHRRKHLSEFPLRP